MNRIRKGLVTVLVLAAAGLSACGNSMSDLDAYIAEVNARPGGRIEPLPVIRPYEPFTYEAYDKRSPFVPNKPLAQAKRPGGGLRPDERRPREFLEQFPLDTLDMVGTLNLGDEHFGLVQTADNLVHRVRVGDYLGQNDGRIVGIDETEIRVVEIVPDGIGGYMERRATLGLGEN